MLFYSLFIISVIKIVICFIHYKNNDTFAEINCEKRMVMSWEKTIFGCLIGGYALLGLLGGNYAYEQEVKALHVYADSVFHEAFHVELQKRGMDQVESWRYGCEDSFVSSVDTAFKKVTIQDEYGTYSFRVDAMKIRKNIVSSPGEQGLHTVVCLTHPLSVDTLNILWRTMLNERQKFPIRTGLKLTVSDNNGVVRSSFSPDSLSCLSYSSIFTYYVGYRCEIEILGFVSISFFSVFVNIVWTLIGVVVAFVLCVILTIYIYKLSVHPPKIKEVTTYIQTVAVKKGTLPIYDLKDDLKLDVGKGVLICENMEVSLTPQQRVLLVLFIKAENHTLSMSQIMADVWPGKSISLDCFHKAIERLRDLLRQLPMTIQIEYLGEEIYQMQIL